MVIGKSQLMESYRVRSLKTWNKMIEPVTGKLRERSKIYTPAEVKIIKAWLEEGVLI